MHGSSLRPRLCVFRSLNHIYSQIVDDSRGTTLVAVSTLDKDIRPQLAGKKKSEEAAIVGAALAKRAIEKGIKQVVFDRGGYKYHGRVKNVAEAARKGGMTF